MEDPRGDGQRRDHEADGEAQPPIVAQHEDEHADEREPAGEELVRAPGEDAVERVDVGVGAVDDPALVGLVEVVEGKFLDVFEDGHAQVVHRALADADRALHLRDGEPPADEQIAEIDQADDEDAVHRRFRRSSPGEETVDADLDELRSEQRRRRGQHGEDEVQRERPSVRPDIAEQAAERPGAHAALLEFLFQLDVVFGRQGGLLVVGCELSGFGRPGRAGGAVGY